MEDLTAIREAAKEGLPVLPETVLSLVKRVKRAELMTEQLRVAGQRVLSEIGAGDDSSDDVRMLESLCTYDDDGEPLPESPLIVAAATMQAAIIRALAGCPFCQMGQCRADAHQWLRDALPKETSA